MATTIAAAAATTTTTATPAPVPSKGMGGRRGDCHRYSRDTGNPDACGSSRTKEMPSRTVKG
jgi:hypothetical protein